MTSVTVAVNVSCFAVRTHQTTPEHVSVCVCVCVCVQQRQTDLYSLECRDICLSALSARRNMAPISNALKSRAVVLLITPSPEKKDYNHSCEVPTI